MLSPAKDGRYFNENRDDRSFTITTDFSETTVLNSDVNEDGQLVVRVKYGPVVYRLQTPENVAFSQADSKILTWNEVPEASGYEVQLMKGDQVIKTITTGRVASCNIGGAGTEGIDGSCYARVKAVPVGTAQKRYLYESGYGVTSTAIDGSSLGTQGQWVNDQGTWRYRLPDNRYYRDGWLEAVSYTHLQVMEEHFGYPGSARLMIDDVTVYQAKDYKKQIEKIDGVDTVSWMDSTVSIYESEAFLAEQDIEDYYKDGHAVMDILFDEGDSSLRTYDAIDSIRQLLGEKGHLSGPALDNKTLEDSLSGEMPKIMAFAVVAILLILTLTTTSWFEPFLFLTTMGIAIVLNMGSNLIFGSISFLSASVSAVLDVYKRQDMIGFDNVCGISLQDLSDRFTPTELLGKLVNACADLPKKALEQVDAIKRITGEDQIKGEYKGGKVFWFKSYAKLIFSANQMPKSYDEKTYAFFRRILMIDIKSKGEPIKNLKEGLAYSMPGFIRECVDTLHWVLVNGQEIDSANSKRLVYEYYRSSDSVTAFLDDCTERVQGSRVKCNELYLSLIHI